MPNAGAQSNSQAAAHPTRPARQWVAHTPAAVDIENAPRGVMTDTDGTVTMEDNQSTPEEIVVDFTAWEIRPLSPTQITATTATTVYLIY